MNPKFAIGDKVKIVNYGALLWSVEPMNLPLLKENDELKMYDWRPNWIGEEGIVTKVIETQGRYQYALHGTPASAWFDEEQLEMISENPNTHSKK